jgi:hypothetical protein
MVMISGPVRSLITSGFLAATLAAPASAQSWQEYTYPDAGFAASFPAQPVIETAPYIAADGKKLTAQIYTVKQEFRIYRVTVADYLATSTDQDTAINHAVSLLHSEGEVGVDIPARVNREYGRQLSLTGKDGSRSVVAIFFANQKLYQIQGTVLANSADPQSGDAARFQQSLRFLGNDFRFGGRGRIPF